MANYTARIWWAGATLAIGSLALWGYWPVFSSEFIHFDDPDYVFENEWVKQGLTGEGIRWALTAGHAGNWHPLTWVSHMLDVSLFGLNSRGHHATNLLFHTANSVLVLVWLGYLTGKRWHSLAVAVIFAIHPMHVESVAWVSERKDVLSTFFGLLCLLAYARYVRRNSTRDPRPATAIPPSAFRFLSSGYYWLALLCLALGLMSKPMLVTWPFVMLLLDLWPLRRLDLATGNAQRATLRPLLLEKFPFFAVVVASCVVTFLVQQQQGAVAPLGLPLESRFVNAGLSYYLYVQKLLWPVDLAFFYPHPAALNPELKSWVTPGVVVAILVVAVVTGLVLQQFRRRPQLTVGWLLYLGTLVPVIGIVQVGEQAMADRYIYFPMIGLAIIVVWGAAELANCHRLARPVVMGVGAIWLALAAWRCQVQAATWKNNESVFGHALKVTRNNATAHLNYGAAHDLKGDYETAARHYRAAIAIDPLLADARFNLGRLLAAQGQVRAAEQEYQQVIQLRPQHALAHNNLGAVREAEGKLAEARQLYQQALTLQPGLRPALLNLARVSTAAGDYPEAARRYREMLVQDPALVEARIGLGLALVMQGAGAEGISHLRRVVELEPGRAEAHYQLAIALTIGGQAREASPHFETAIRLRPTWVAALNEYAWMLAAHPDAQVRNGAEAVRLAEKARDLSGGQEARCWGTLDAAYAEAGRFSDAIAAAEQTIKLARASGQPDLAAAAEQRLALYRQGKPYQQGP
jgi:tetratricopeptide (TPR) repeat protein